MTEPSTEPHRPVGTGGVPWQWQLAVAALLLLAFLVIGVMMIITADTSDAVWKNRIAIFSAFQSLVFGAAGWLFGREINRVPAEIARSEAAEAKELARDNADEAAEARVRAATEEMRGRALAAAVTSTANSANGGPSARESSAFERPGTGPSPQIAALAAMAEDLYGSR